MEWAVARCSTYIPRRRRGPRRQADAALVVGRTAAESTGRVNVLISGASIAGPTLGVLAHRTASASPSSSGRRRCARPAATRSTCSRPPWTSRADGRRSTAVQERRTGTKRMSVWREGARRPVTIDLGRADRRDSGRHVEIMRDDLGEISRRHPRRRRVRLRRLDHRDLAHDGEVTFEARRAAPLRPRGRRRRAALQRAPARLRTGAGVHALLGRLPRGARSANYRDLRDTMAVRRRGRPPRRHVQRAAHGRRAGAVPVPHPSASSTSTTTTSTPSEAAAAAAFAGMDGEVPRLLDEPTGRGVLLRLDHPAASWTPGRVGG